MRGRIRIQTNIASGTAKHRAGMTLVEVCVAMALTAMMCGGLYAAGLQARKSADHNRLTTEARSLAKERLEEMIAFGCANLAKDSCTMTNISVHQSTLGYRVVRRPQIIWHAADRSVVPAANAAYAELHVSVSYDSPLAGGEITDVYSSIVQ